jgi:lipid-A-disaccharide synthase
MLERVMIISGESSGELYGSFLAGALRERNPGIALEGVGGDRMQAAGVRLIARIASAFGAVEAVRAYREIKRTYHTVVETLSSFNPQVLVTIDYPDFNIRVAKKAKSAGIKVLYFVSPQVWAWRKGRVRVIGRVVDKMAVILPFEEDIYMKAGIPCEFVGHPVMDEIRDIVQAAGFGMQDLGSAQLKAHFRKELGLDSSRPVLAVMPGSRRHEVQMLLPSLAEAVSGITLKYPGCQLTVPVAPNLEPDVLAALRERLGTASAGALRFSDNSVKTLLAADYAIIASGTSTLQAALAGVPLVVIYRLSPITFLLGKLIVKVKYISLVNILLDKSVKGCTALRVRELLQGAASGKNIMAEIARLMEEASYREEMIRQLALVRDLFRDKSASLRVAEILEEMGAQG